MNWLRIIHETDYRYSTVVRFGTHRLVLRPREGHDVQVKDMRLEISPEFDLKWTRDVFGNSVATADFLSPADRLTIRSEVLLQQTERFPLRSGRSATSVPFPARYSDLELAVVLAYQATTFPQDVGRVKQWVDSVMNLRAVASAEDAVATVARTIRDTIQYRRRDAKGVQTPSETLSAGSGSCRDMATLMLESLRVIGLPARFASGYLDCAASEAGGASTHAWAEAYLPEIGWTGYDPMLGVPTSGRHVVTGVSHHPRGVMPIVGTFFGLESSFLGMTVAVQTERLANPARVDAQDFGRTSETGFR